MNPNNPDRGDDGFDDFAHAAGEALRRPAPAGGLAGVRSVRRRQRAVRAGAVIGAAVIVLVVGAVVVTNQGDSERLVPSEVSISPPPGPSTSPSVIVDPPTVSVAPSTTPISSTVAPSTTPVSSAVAPSTSPISSAVAVAATSNGVVVDSGDNTWDTVVIADTSRGTPRLIDGFVVYQATNDEQPVAPSGPILVSDGVETREFTDGDKELVLLDVGHVDGATVILASSLTPMPPNPDSVDDRLLLIDANSFEVTDLGQFGGWESSVTSARFGDDAIALTLTVTTSRTLEVIEFDGTSRYSIELPSEGFWNLTDFGGSVWALDARFREPDFDEFLDIRQIDLTDGSVREATIDVDLSGLGERAADGFCADADFLDGQMLCDQSAGVPFTFPIDGDAVATPVPGLSDGTVMFRASQ